MYFTCSACYNQYYSHAFLNPCPFCGKDSSINSEQLSNEINKAVVSEIEATMSGKHGTITNYLNLTLLH